ncbi:MAG: glycosyltransferase 87 family protein [Actinobacteria bacterium]|nr:glycosyltransferase 87 family protein [Actinomycetota bacterium]
MIKIKILLLFIFLGISVFVTTFSFIELRQRTSASGFINDSALQTEIAGRYLLLGKNPYVENYVNTDLAKWPYKDETGNTLNPALYANVTPPFMIALSALGFRIFSRLTGSFDIRFLLLVSYFALILLGIVKFGFRQNLLLFLVLVCLQPIFLMSAMQGSNDIVIVTLLLWGLYFLERKNLLLSGILLGLSVAAKQTAWFIIPFYLIYLLQHYKRKQFITFLLPYIVIISLFYLPFMLWNFPALINNLIFYTSYHPYQNLPIHPIEGYGFSFLLYSLGIVRSIYSQYPFWIYQIFIGVSFLLFFLKLQLKKRMNIAYVLYGSTTLITIVWFFNRYFLVSHIGYILVMLGTSYVWTLKTEKLEN